MRHQITALALLVLLAVAAAAPTATSADCAALPADREMATSAAVFLGVVERIRTVQGSRDLVVLLRVVRSWKGDVHGRLEITVHPGHYGDIPAFRVGARYLAFATLNGDALETYGGCTNSAIMNRALEARLVAVLNGATRTTPSPRPR